MDKKALRSYYLQLRLQLSEAEWVQGSKRMCDLFFIHVDLAFVRSLHIFLPLKKKAEPDTWLIIERIKREFPHVQIVIPKIDPTTKQLRSIVLEGTSQLTQNEWGIEEPDFGKEVAPKEVDVVIVPLLVFDRSGHRIGYGKGFYDKFLSQCRADSKKIGLSFFEPVENIQSEPFDVALTSVITPSSYFSF
jgi:5-formyltetrahydrofolate cyclo-ligase